jgi:hypothetical protein
MILFAVLPLCPRQGEWQKVNFLLPLLSTLQSMKGITAGLHASFGSTIENLFYILIKFD